MKKKKIFCINTICYENDLIYFLHVSSKNFENRKDLLLITDVNKSYYVYIKTFHRFMCNKTKNKNKKHFCRYCLQWFSSAKALQEHKKVFLKINCRQSVKLRIGSIKFKKRFKQLVVSFKIYVRFESILKEVQSNYDRNSNVFYTRKYQEHIPSFAYKFVCIDDKFIKAVVLYREKMQSINLLQ